MLYWFTVTDQYSAQQHELIGYPMLDIRRLDPMVVNHVHERVQTKVDRVNEDDHELRRIQKEAYEKAVIHLQRFIEEQTNSPANNYDHPIESMLKNIQTEYCQKHHCQPIVIEELLEDKILEMKDAAGILASAESNERLDATTQDFQSMTRECDEAEQQFQQYEKIKRLSRARDHLSLVRYDLEYFHETQSKMIEFETRLVESNYERMDEMYAEWKPFDQWRYRMIEQICQKKGKLVGALVLKHRWTQIQEFGNRLWQELSDCIYNCIDLAQYDPDRLTQTFQVAERMEQDFAKQTIDTMAYFSIKLSPARRIELEIENAAKLRVQSLQISTSASDNYTRPIFRELVDAGTSLLFDLKIVQQDVQRCLHVDQQLSAVDIYIQAYNVYFEQMFLTPANVTEMLEMIEWIDYYESEMQTFGRLKKIEHTGTSLHVIRTQLLDQYLEQVQAQMSTWLENIWNRDDSSVAHRKSGTLHSPAPQDMIDILKTQLSIAADHLSELSLLQVSKQLMLCLYQVYHKNADSRLLSTQEHQTQSGVDLENLCCLINDTDTLQNQCQDLVSVVETKLKSEKWIHEFNTTLDRITREFIALAGRTCHCVCQQIFQEMTEDQVFVPWFRLEAWEREEEPVMENLCLTLEDFFHDLHEWVSGRTFFLPKILRFCLERTVREYEQRFVTKYGGRVLQPSQQPRVSASGRMSSILNRVQADYQIIMACFTKYMGILKWTGIRTQEDLRFCCRRIRWIISALELDLQDDHVLEALEIKKLDEDQVDIFRQVLVMRPDCPPNKMKRLFERDNDFNEKHAPVTVSAKPASAFHLTVKRPSVMMKNPFTAFPNAKTLKYNASFHPLKEKASSAEKGGVVELQEQEEARPSTPSKLKMANPFLDPPAPQLTHDSNKFKKPMVTLNPKNPFAASASSISHSKVSKNPFD